MKIEKDAAEVTAGVRHGRTLGGPVALTVANRDFANWEERMNPWPVEADVPEVHLPRPGHADLAGVQKFGFTDVRNVLERASARETAARVAGGALAKAFLRALGVEVVSHVTQIGSVRAPERDDLALEDFADVDASPVRCLDAEASRGDGRGDQRPAQAQRVARRRLRGARVRARARARLARVAGRSASTGGSAWRCSRSRPSRAAGSATASTSPAGPGSEAHDEIFYSDERGYYRETNRSGGIEGGMTTGEPLVVRCAMKPLPTLTKPLRSVDIATHEPAQALRERTDSCRRPGRRRRGGGDAGDRARRRLPREVRRRPHRRRARRASTPTSGASAGSALRR